MNILSIQSHVNYGYVGNKAATFPLQSLGFDVWPINTVQFSNHTGYGHWQGETFSAEHIRALIKGLEALDLAQQCHAILSGYIGDKAIGEIIVETVQRFKKINPHLIYLCDPVMGDPGGKGCFVKQDILPFFRDKCLDVADIITPNHFEAEILYKKEIHTLKELQQSASFFHSKGVKIVVITRLQLEQPLSSPQYSDFMSVNNTQQWAAKTPPLTREQPINGAGDLFSALYLGHFLLTNDPLQAFQNAVSSTHKIIAATIDAQQRELKIITTYRDVQPHTIPFERLKS